MISFDGINWVAVLIGIVLSNALGFIWYGPLFGNTWMRMIGKSSVSAVNSALYRARIRVQQTYPSSGMTPLASDPATQALLERYVNAWEAADLNGLVAMLKDDATFPMPPIPTWVMGREAIREFISRNILNGAARGRWRLVPTEANSSPAFGWYRRQPDRLTYAAFGIQVVRLEDGLVADATTFSFPNLFPAFNLPDKIQEVS